MSAPAGGRGDCLRAGPVAVGAGLLCVGLLLLAVVSVERSELRLLANDGERQLDLHAAQADATKRLGIYNKSRT